MRLFPRGRVDRGVGFLTLRSLSAIAGERTAPLSTHGSARATLPVSATGDECLSLTAAASAVTDNHRPSMSLTATRRAMPEERRGRAPKRPQAVVSIAHRWPTAEEGSMRPSFIRLAMIVAAAGTLNAGAQDAGTALRVVPITASSPEARRAFIEGHDQPEDWLQGKSARVLPEGAPARSEVRARACVSFDLRRRRRSCPARAGGGSRGDAADVRAALHRAVARVRRTTAIAPRRW